jgi:hypothetical protein
VSHSYTVCHNCTLCVTIAHSVSHLYTVGCHICTLCVTCVHCASHLHTVCTHVYTVSHVYTVCHNCTPCVHMCTLCVIIVHCVSQSYTVCHMCTLCVKFAHRVYIKASNDSHLPLHLGHHRKLTNGSLIGQDLRHAPHVWKLHCA